MVEVFITNIQSSTQAEKVQTMIQSLNAALKIHMDLHETDAYFPCGNTILRIEGNEINSYKIMEIVRRQGFNCEILEDKICTQSGPL